MMMNDYPNLLGLCDSSETFQGQWRVPSQYRSLSKTTTLPSAITPISSPLLESSRCSVLQDSSAIPAPKLKVCDTSQLALRFVSTIEYNAT